MSKRTKDLVEYVLIFVFALVELFLFAFGGMFENQTLVMILIFAIPLALVGSIYYKYRKYHLAHIFNKE